MDFPSIAPKNQERLKHRPASVRRSQRMQLLIARLGQENLSTDDIAALLACSHTAARNYVGQLLSANVIVAVRRQGRVGLRGSRLEYRLTGDAPCVAHFLAHFLALLVAQPDDAAPVQLAPAFRRQVHLIERGEHMGHLDKTIVPRRDALVAALFGPVA